MNTPVTGRSRAPEWDRAAITDTAAEMDAIAAVVAHGALNSLAVIVGALSALQLGSGIEPEEQQQLLSRAMKHTGSVNAVLCDLVRGLPIGLTPVVDDEPTRSAANRFGVGRGVGMDGIVEIRPTGVHPSVVKGEALER